MYFEYVLYITQVSLLENILVSASEYRSIVPGQVGGARVFALHPHARAFAAREHVSLPEIFFYISEMCMKTLLEIMLEIYFEYKLFIFLNIYVLNIGFSA